MPAAAVGTAGRVRASVDIVWIPRPSAAPIDLSVGFTPDATVADLAAALGHDGERLIVEGRPVEGATRLCDAGMFRGARVMPATQATRPQAASCDIAALELCVVGGTLTGLRFPLPSGSHTLGRSTCSTFVLDAPSVSATHAVLDVGTDAIVTVEDLGSTNGTWVDGVFAGEPTVAVEHSLIRLGSIALQVRRSEPRVEILAPGEDGTAAFNRPPRPVATQPPAPIAVPPSAAEPRPPARLAWATLIAPVVLGAAMALMYDPRFAAFAAFSPAMMLGTWAEERRRARRDERDGRTSTAEALETFSAALAAAGNVELRRRRAAFPTAGVVTCFASGPGPRLWERRPGHDDFLQLALGFATVSWRPPTVDPGRPPAPDATAMVTRACLDEAPLTVNLRGGQVCGITGPPAVAAGLARNLVVQAAALHGPADLRVAVFTQPDRADHWEWVKWLPHSSSGALSGSTRLLAATPSDHDTVATAVRRHAQTTLVVVDSDALLHQRSSVVRRLLGDDGVAGIVISSVHEALPAACTAVVTCNGDDGAGHATTGATAVDDVLLAGVPTAVARSVARELARIDDPEVEDEGGAPPDAVALLDLLDLPELSAELVAERWSSASRPAVPVGVGKSGPVVLDLAADGPHGLIAGTTGAGKSELLRSIIAGLAMTVGPADLTFVLIDYKGGSAFDACAGLPHTVGIVTDLDEALSRRALRCLEAELRYRERLLRAAGAIDVADYRSRALSSALRPLPRLLVAVDEFATLAAELPDFVDRLVSIAQRGRSLGVHLLLATQRPAGAVSDHIRANTNVRIALRVHDAADSRDVIGTADAAALQRGRPGRGYLRLGPGELVAFQSAYVSGVSNVSPEPVTARSFGVVVTAGDIEADNTTGAGTDLQRLVAAARGTFERTGDPPPRRPWPEPLPPLVPLEDVVGRHAEQGVTIGLADDPDGQQWIPFVLDPAAGSMALFGALGSGPTDTLVTIALALEAKGNVHCYVVDAGRQSLAPLASRPHVGAVIAAGDRERQQRLIRFLVDEVAERRARAAAGTGSAAQPSIVVLLDNYAAFAAGFDDLVGLTLMDDFARVVADGPALGVTVIATAARINAIPAAMAATMPQRLLFALPDRHHYAQFGVDALDDPLPNRAVDAASGLVVQIADPGPVENAVRPRVDGLACSAPRSIGVLPSEAPVAAILDDAAFTGSDWHLPVGIDDRSLQPAGWHLGPGDHALITGPARSGKSTSLCVVAEAAAKVGADVPLYGVALRRSPLQTCPHMDRVATSAEDLDELVEAITDPTAPALLLIDDAEGVDDASGTLTRLLATRRDDVWCIAAGRADVLRTHYAHWTVEIRRSRQGLALRPNVDLDGDLWHTPLPRREVRAMRVGRGYLITDGVATLLQAATS